jgi:hypothetical protein
MPVARYWSSVPWEGKEAYLWSAETFWGQYFVAHVGEDLVACIPVGRAARMVPGPGRSGPWAPRRVSMSTNRRIAPTRVFGAVVA